MHKLTILPDKYAVAQLPPGTALPDWMPEEGFLTISRTADELSIVCRDVAVPAGVRVEHGWRVLMLAGPFDFSLTGILASVLNPLAASEVGIFAISTFDTDYVLVKIEHLGRAVEALRAAGHQVDA